MKEQNNIEEVFQKAFKEFEVDPGPKVWTNVHSTVQGAAASTTVAAKTALSIMSKTIIGITIGSIAIGGYFLLTKSSDDNSIAKVVVTESALSNEIPSTKNQSLSAKNEEEDQAVTAQGIDDSPSKLLTENEVHSKNYGNNKKAASKVNVAVNDFIDTIRNAIGDPGTAEQSIEKVSQNEINQNSNDVMPKETASSSIETTTVNESSSIVEESSDSEAVSSPNDIKAQSKEEAKALNLVIPNAFSPNLDGTNDAFIVESNEVDLMEIEIHSISLNKIVYKGKGKIIEWDGTLPNGSLAPEGQYMYQLILFKDGIEYPKPGIVTLRH